MESVLMSYKTFVNGLNLSAGELNTYVMPQVIAVFADSTERAAAITSPATGQFTYLTGTAVLQYWNGSAWTTFTSGGGASGDTLDPFLLMGA